jgi:trans-aconitate methyltransferase
MKVMKNRWTDEIAEIRNKQISSKIDITFCKIFIPYYCKLIQKIKPRNILDVGCGTGHLSFEIRKKYKAKVHHALEPSEGMYNLSKKLLLSTDIKIFKNSLQKHWLSIKYDLIFAHFVLQAEDRLDLFLNAIKSHMNEKSIFIFCIPHPCFWYEYKKNEGWFTKDYKYMKNTFQKVDLTITKDPSNSLKNIPYNHRPLKYYFKLLRKNGLYVIDFDEIYPTQSLEKLYGKPWKHPRYCVFQVKAMPLKLFLSN